MPPKILIDKKKNSNPQDDNNDKKKKHNIKKKKNDKKISELRKKERDLFLEKQASFLRESILHYRDYLIYPPNKFSFGNTESHSWFDHNYYNVTTNTDFKFEHDYPIEKIIINSISVQLLFTDQQRLIIDKWLEAHRLMYNATLHYYKQFHYKNRNTDKKISYSFKTIRTYHIKNIKDKIIENSVINLPDEKKLYVRSHILDSAISLVCNNYKSAISNLKAGNIKQFRIRYWRKNQLQKSMEVETASFSKKFNTFF